MELISCTQLQGLHNLVYGNPIYELQALDPQNLGFNLEE